MNPESDCSYSDHPRGTPGWQKDVNEVRGRGLDITLEELGRRVSDALESRTGGHCTYEWRPRQAEGLSFRLEVDGEVVGALCDGTNLRLSSTELAERGIVEAMLKKLSEQRKETP